MNRFEENDAPSDTSAFVEGGKMVDMYEFKGSARPRIPVNNGERGSSFTVEAAAVNTNQIVSGRNGGKESEKKRTESLVIDSIRPQLYRVPNDGTLNGSLHVVYGELCTAQFGFRRVVKTTTGSRTRGGTA